MAENNLEMDMKHKLFSDTTLEPILSEENLQFRLVRTSLFGDKQFYCVLSMKEGKVTEHKHYTHSPEGFTEASEFYANLLK